MLFSRGNLVAGQVASKNPVDLGINCLHLDKDGSTVATNGRVLMAVGPVDEEKIKYPHVGERAEVEEQGKSIPLDLVAKAIRNLPKDKKPVLQHAALTKGRDPNKVEFTTTDMRHEDRVAGSPIRQPFPDWRGIIRRIKGTDSIKVCLNRTDLIELLRALEDACPDRGGENAIFLEINAEGTGIVARNVNRDTGQRAVGAISAYKTSGQWLPADTWETKIFNTKVVRKVPKHA